MTYINLDPRPPPSARCHRSSSSSTARSGRVVSGRSIASIDSICSRSRGASCRPAWHTPAPGQWSLATIFTYRAASVEMGSFFLTNGGEEGGHDQFRYRNPPGTYPSNKVGPRSGRYGKYHVTHPASGSLALLFSLSPSLSSTP